MKYNPKSLPLIIGPPPGKDDLVRVASSRSPHALGLKSPSCYSPVRMREPGNRPLKSLSPVRAQHGPITIRSSTFTTTHQTKNQVENAHLVPPKPWRRRISKWNRPEPSGNFYHPCATTQWLVVMRHQTTNRSKLAVIKPNESASECVKVAGYPPRRTIIAKRSLANRSHDKRGKTQENRGKQTKTNSENFIRNDGRHVVALHFASHVVVYPPFNIVLLWYN